MSRIDRTTIADLSDLPPALTVEEAAALVGIGRSAGYEAVRAGALPSVRIGNRVIVPTLPLLRLLGADGFVERDAFTDSGKSQSERA
jgi:excisionase family DNA binding protein